VYLRSFELSGVKRKSVRRVIDSARMCEMSRLHAVTRIARS
jgi:hypothetical protein